MAQAKNTPRSTVTRLGANVRKADTQALITNGADAFPEDSFVGSYWTGGNTGYVAILEPTFKPGVLKAVASQNNSLLQCIEAMEVNIDGTGHTIELLEDHPESEAEKQIITDFFAEPYPGKSMTQIRRAIRRDLEQSGMGYLEVISNAADDTIMINDQSADDMRLLRLDDPVPVTKTLTRGGKEVSVSVRTRERRFVQMINGKKVYFKEFGASRDVDRDTGEWAPQGSRLPVDKRGSEIIVFSGNKEPKTPYGSPRWISQLPSVLGSRKAEEHNLEFFDGGGIPPVLVLVEGGTLGDTVKNELRNHLSGKGNKHRAAVVEALSTSGTLDSAGSVKVRVERFGAERQQDAMFQSYDKNCEEHIRCAFRLPPLFIGKASDYTFATAYTAYMVAEAQVFYPEREEFDAVINATIVKSLGVKNYKFRSMPLTLVDVQNQLKALELASTNKAISGKELVSKLNEVTGLSMEFEQQPEPPPPGAAAGPAPVASNPALGEGLGGPGAGPGKAAPALKDERLVQLAARWARVVSGDQSVSKSEQDSTRAEVGALSPEEAEFVSSVVALQFITAQQRESMAELCGCASHIPG